VTWDWLDTVRRGLLELPDIRRHSRPTFALPSVLAIDRRWLKQHGIRGVIWDVDGTLTGYHEEEIPPASAGHLYDLFADRSLTHAVLSNCDERRFAALGKLFAGVLVARAYATSEGTVIRHLFQGRDSHSPEGLRALLAAGGRAIRKPSPVPVKSAIELMHGTRPSEVVMVGDQYFTDVAAASRAGIRSVKVPTCRPRTFPLPLRLAQRIEACLALGT